MTSTEIMNEPGYIDITGHCTTCKNRSDRCTCDVEPTYELQRLHNQIKIARGEFERAVMAQLESGIPHRQIAWQVGVTVGAIQTIERKYR